MRLYQMESNHFDINLTAKTLRFYLMDSNNHALNRACQNGAVENTYLRDVEVCKKLAISRPTLWRWVQLSSFPAPVRFSAGCSRWRLKDVFDWEAQKRSEVK